MLFSLPTTLKERLALIGRHIRQSGAPAQGRVADGARRHSVGVEPTPKAHGAQAADLDAALRARRALEPRALHLPEFGFSESARSRAGPNDRKAFLSMRCFDRGQLSR